MKFPLAATGETPVQSLGHEFGGREDYSHRDWAFSASIDAPDLIPAGSHRNDNYDEVPVSRYVAR